MSSSDSPAIDATRPNEFDKRRFAGQFKRALKLRARTMRSISKETGISYAGLKKLKAGTAFPLPETVEKLAEALDSIAITTAARLDFECEHCGKTYFQGARRPAKYCSERCRGTARKQRYGQNKANEFLRRGKTLALYEDSIMYHCLDCTGGATVCPDGGCKLRPVSPLPLREKTNAYTPPDSPRVDPTRIAAAIRVIDVTRRTR